MQKIRIQVEEYNAPWLRALPLDPSQQEEVKTEDYTVFFYYMDITKEVIERLKIISEYIEILEPQTLQSAIKGNCMADAEPCAPEQMEDQLRDSLFILFKNKGYTAEDFYGGCALCGEANDFALDIIDEAVLKAMPDMPKFDRDRLTSKLYGVLHRLFEQEEQF